MAELIPLTQFEALAPNKDRTVVRPIFKALMARYGESHRHYHVLPHLVTGLGVYAELFSKPLTPEQFFAWVYHDSVYNPQNLTPGDNEKNSGALFLQDAIPLGFTLEFAEEKVLPLILSTDPSKDAVSVINDMDVCILGFPPRQYNAYVRKVRKEYAFVPDEVWREGRSAVLRQLLEKKLFFTREFAAKFSAQAEKNMERELKSLKKTAPAR